MLKIANSHPTLEEAAVIRARIDRMEREIVRLRKAFRANAIHAGVANKDINALLNAGGFGEDGKLKGRET